MNISPSQKYSRKLERQLKRLEYFDTRRESIQEQIQRLQAFKKLEGKIALVEVAVGARVKVQILGWERKSFGRDLFRVEPLDGEGWFLTSGEKLELVEDKVAVPA